MSHEDVVQFQYAGVRKDLLAGEVTGAPFLGLLAGLARRPTSGGGFALTFEPNRPALAGNFGVLEAALLGDLTLGGAIRERAGQSLPLPTMYLSLQAEGESFHDLAYAVAEAQPPRGRSAGASAQLHASDGRPVGRCQAVFALPRLPFDGSITPMPWDQWLDAALAPADVDGHRSPGQSGAETTLTPALEALVQEIAEHGVTAGVGPTWMSSHLRVRMEHPGDMEVILHPTAVMANRGNNVQGGVLYAFAALAVAEHGDFEPDTFCAGTMHFLRAASLEGPLTAHATLLQTGRRTLMGSVAIQQQDYRVAQATMLFRR